MISIDVKDVGSTMRALLTRVAEGETVVVVDSTKPIAEIHAAEEERTAERHIGLAKASFQVPASFFEPLPEEEISAFEGASR